MDSLEEVLNRSGTACRIETLSGGRGGRLERAQCEAVTRPRSSSHWTRADVENRFAHRWKCWSGSRKIETIQADAKGAVEEQSATTSEMSRSVAEAARGAGEVARNIQGVAEAAQSTSHGATDS